jgi:ATP synthase protein I
MGKPDPTSKKLIQVYAQAGTYLSAGLQFAFTILLGLFAGRWLDARLGTDSLCLVAGTFLGAGAGFYHLYRDLVAEAKKKKEKGD